MGENSVTEKWWQRAFLQNGGSWGVSITQVYYSFFASGKPAIANQNILSFISPSNVGPFVLNFDGMYLMQHHCCFLSHSASFLRNIFKDSVERRG